MESNKNRNDDSDVDTMADDLKTAQGDDADQLDKLDLIEGHIAEAPSSPPAIAAKNKAFFFTLPAELRIQIYEMVIAAMPKTQDRNHPVGEFNLCQPALARVNRQLRGEVLHMWYRAKMFGINICPKRHSEVDQVWQDFLDRWNAHTAGADGSHHLSRIRRLQVELWHPTSYEPVFDYYFPPRPSQISLLACNGVYIRFGAHGEPLPRSVGVVNNDWTNRHLVRGLLEASIVETRRRYWDDSNLKQFWETYPFERLVDLVMMIAGECEEAAGSLYVSTSFPPTWW